MDISNLILAVVCCLLPYCASLGLVAVFTTRAKYKSALKNLRNLEKSSPDSVQPRASEKLLRDIAILGIVFLGLLMAGLTVLLWYLLESQAVLHMTEASIWNVFVVLGVAGFTIGIITVLISVRLFGKHFPSKDS